MQDAQPLQPNPAPDVKPESGCNERSEARPSRRKAESGLPWWLTSKTLYGLLTLGIAYLLSKNRGVAVSPDDQVALDLADNLIAIIGAGLALAGRIHAERKIRGATSPRPAAPILPIEPYVPQPQAIHQPRPLAPLCIAGAALLLAGCTGGELRATGRVDERGEFSGGEVSVSVPLPERRADPKRIKPPSRIDAPRLDLSRAQIAEAVPGRLRAGGPAPEIFLNGVRQ